MVQQFLVSSSSPGNSKEVKNVYKRFPYSAILCWVSATGGYMERQRDWLVSSDDFEQAEWVHV